MSAAPRATPLVGECGCGAVRFEVTAPLHTASYCHCTRCQRRSGTAASANARVARDRFASSSASRACGRGGPLTAGRSGSAGSAARRSSRAIRAILSARAYASGRSTPIRRSGRASGSSSHMPRAGRRSPTTGCHATRRARTCSSVRGGQRAHAICEVIQRFAHAGAARRAARARRQRTKSIIGADRLLSSSQMSFRCSFLPPPPPPSGGIARGGRVAANPAEKKPQETKRSEDMSTAWITAATGRRGARTPSRTDLRHDAARRRAVAGHLAERVGEARDRPAARAPRRRRDRGRLPDRLARRLRGRPGDRARRSRAR